MPTWLRNPFRPLLDSWTALTAPYRDTDDLPPAARYVHTYVTIMAGFGSVVLGVGLVMLATSAGFPRELIAEPLEVLGHAVSILTPVPVYLAMRVRHRSWLAFAAACTVVSLALSVIGMGERTSSYTFAMKITMLIALYTLWRESDS